VGKLSVWSRFLRIYNRRYMIDGKHRHLWNFIEVKKSPIYERIMYKGLKTGRRNNLFIKKNSQLLT